MVTTMTGICDRARPGIFGSIEWAVEAAGRTDEREMGQKDVSAMFPAAPALLGMEPGG
jgi:hypothetical protein